MVRTTTWESGTASLSRRMASKPLIPGMLMSITTTSGCVSSVMRRAPTPSAASPTSVMASSEARIMRRPARTMAWSSTSSTRIATARSSRGQWYANSNAGAAARPRIDGELAPQEAHSLLHTYDAQMLLSRPADLVGIEAAAVVFDHRLHRAVRPRAAPGALTGIGVFDDVGHRLLDKAVEVDLQPLGQAGVEAAGPHDGLDAGLGERCLGVPVHGCGEAEGVQEGGSQVKDDASDLLERARGDVTGLGQGAPQVALLATIARNGLLQGVQAHDQAGEGLAHLD